MPWDGLLSSLGWHLFAASLCPLPSTDLNSASARQARDLIASYRPAFFSSYLWCGSVTVPEGIEDTDERCNLLTSMLPIDFCFFVQPGEMELRQLAVWSSACPRKFVGDPGQYAAC